MKKEKKKEKKETLRTNFLYMKRRKQEAWAQEMVPTRWLQPARQLHSERPPALIHEE